MFTRPAMQISARADRIGMGALDAPEIQVQRRDEDRALDHALAQMRKGMVQL